jgi:hypothetical protein
LVKKLERVSRIRLIARLSADRDAEKAYHRRAAQIMPVSGKKPIINAMQRAPLHRVEPSLGPHPQQEPRRRLCIRGSGPLALRLRVLLRTSENMPSSDAGGCQRAGAARRQGSGLLYVRKQRTTAPEAADVMCPG